MSEMFSAFDLAELERTDNGGSIILASVCRPQSRTCALCAGALVFVALRFIMPLVAMHLAGVGVEIPLPRRFTTAYPKLAVYFYSSSEGRYSSPLW